ncbi:MAG: hypothetical protein PHF67_00025 [Candidatus Nanoarchaeia archaeon]|nr:hypothetical protein [Candidatus Nanoarchaeia archaeon]
MFKKKCGRCGEKINKNFDFCPVCGSDQKSKNYKEDFGLLGKSDIPDEPLFRTGNSFMEKMFETAFKVLEKQMKNIPNDSMNPPATSLPNNMHIQFFVNGKRVLPDNFNNKQAKPIVKKIKNVISEDRLSEISKLPREEPSSKLKRMSGKIIYEFNVPGVRNIEDIIINKLENSVEIKALAENKVYSKTLNIKLPVLGYKLVNGNLSVEFLGQ